MYNIHLKGTSTPTKTSIKPQDIAFAITLVLIFVQKSVYSGEKRSLELHIFVFKFPMMIQDELQYKNSQTFCLLITTMTIMCPEQKAGKVNLNGNIAETKLQL